MDVWQILLYGSAAYLTMQLLMRLMETHRQRRLKELAAEHRQIKTEAPAPAPQNAADEQNNDASQAA